MDRARAVRILNSRFRGASPNRSSKDEAYRKKQHRSMLNCGPAAKSRINGLKGKARIAQYEIVPETQGLNPWKPHVLSQKSTLEDSKDSRIRRLGIALSSNECAKFTRHEFIQPIRFERIEMG